MVKTAQHGPVRESGCEKSWLDPTVISHGVHIGLSPSVDIDPLGWLHKCVYSHEQ